MRIRGILAAFSAMLLLAGMFVAVHRGARGREIAQRIRETSERQEGADVTRSELKQEIEYLRSRGRIVRAAEELGLHTPSGEEIVILHLRGQAMAAGGAS